MKILITHDSSGLKSAGFLIDEEYVVSEVVGRTLIGSKWAVEVKAETVPENKALLAAPENK